MSTGGVLEADSQARVPLSAFVPATLRAALERRAEVNDRSLSAELRQALRDYLGDSDA